MYEKVNSDVVSECHYSQPLDLLNQTDLSESIQIPEVELKPERVSFETSVHRVMAYVEVNGKYPYKNDSDKAVARLGNFVADCRSKHTKGVLKDHKIDYIESKLKDFVWAVRKDTFIKNIDDLQVFIENNGHNPRINHKQTTLNERKLAKFVAHVRESYQNKNNVDSKSTYVISEQRMEYLLKKIPDFVFKVDIQDQHVQSAIRLNEFIMKHGKYPRKSGVNRDVEEKQLGSFIQNLKYAIKANRPTFPSILNCLDIHCPLFDYKTEYQSVLNNN